eukprot:UN16680
MGIRGSRHVHKFLLPDGYAEDASDLSQEDLSRRMTCTAHQQFLRQHSCCIGSSDHNFPHKRR